jgi:acyl-CoA thioester hydrolase
MRATVCKPERCNYFNQRASGDVSAADSNFGANLHPNAMMVGVMYMKKCEPEFIETMVTVRYAETDQMGVVYHANYLVWFEVGRVAWCKAKGFQYAEMESRDNLFLMVAESSCRYKAPARFSEDIVVRTALARATDRVIRYQYEVRRKAGWELLATGETAHVVTDSSCRPARLPDHYREMFSLPSRRGSIGENCH